MIQRFYRPEITNSDSAGNGQAASFDMMLHKVDHAFRVLYDVLPETVVGKQLLGTMLHMQKMKDDAERVEFIRTQLDSNGDKNEQHYVLGVQHFLKNRVRESVDEFRAQIFADPTTTCHFPASDGCVVCVDRMIVADDVEAKDEDVRMLLPYLLEVYSGKRVKGNKCVMASRKLSKRQKAIAKAAIATKKKKRKSSSSSSSSSSPSTSSSSSSKPKKKKQKMSKKMSNTISKAMKHVKTV
jgi:hypothetical protein